MGRTNDIMVTNDGATILKSLYVDNPAAKVLVGESKLSTQPVFVTHHTHVAQRTIASCLQREGSLHLQSCSCSLVSIMTTLKGHLLSVCRHLPSAR